MKLLTKASLQGEANQREKENLQVAYRAACEGIVLLKNDGALPFSTKRVALYGAGATMTIKGGTGSGEVNERHSVTVREGMEDRGFHVVTRCWLADYEKGYKEAAAAYKVEKRKRLNLFKLNSIMQMLFDNFRLPAGRPIIEEDVWDSKTDSCVYVLSRQAGEGGDRRAEAGDYFLTAEELAHIRFCAEHYAKFVLVINCGSSMDLSSLEEISGINAILYICQLGTEGGHALADILSGAVTPSGKLADTWARRYEDIPNGWEYSYLNGDLDYEYYKEGIFVGYRYFDSFGVKPAYPFGFGLSYTDFSIVPLGVSAEGTVISVEAAVKNTGDRSGKEVAQVYVSAPGEDREYQSLAAFIKTKELAPGEEQKLTLRFDLKDLACYRTAKACFALEKGSYLLRLGTSSRDTEIVGVAELEGEAVTARVTNICPPNKAFEELKAPRRSEEVSPADVPHIFIDPDCVETQVCTYEKGKEQSDGRVQEFLNTLTLDDMAEIVVGIGMFGGEKKFDLPGSVGNTTSKFWDRGLVNAPLCDGPAGLRIQKRSTVDEKGCVKPVEMAMSVFEALPSFIKRFMVGDPEKDTVLYQYTTAFPVATALAQSWNTALWEEVGRAIGREMKEYGCTYWLAPAVNIHRNPLCGRNFEYFSEDPFLTGEAAAALTRGIQGEKGIYVTVKHFACNNQEDHRNYVSSEVSERALREIYLRGFERAVKQGGAKGIMTSYNRVNGVYTCNSHDLCMKVLRNEWGFDGVVMTDWFSTNAHQGDNALCMRAGNDLIMPGGKSFQKKLLKGVKQGVITEEEVRWCCANVVKAIFDSALQKEYMGK